MDKFIGFDIDHKHRLACVVQASQPGRYRKLRTDVRRTRRWYNPCPYSFEGLFCGHTTAWQALASSGPFPTCRVQHSVGTRLARLRILPPLERAVEQLQAFVPRERRVSSLVDKPVHLAGLKAAADTQSMRLPEDHRHRHTHRLAG